MWALVNDVCCAQIAKPRNLKIQSAPCLKVQNKILLYVRSTMAKRTPASIPGHAFLRTLWILILYSTYLPVLFALYLVHLFSFMPVVQKCSYVWYGTSLRTYSTYSTGSISSPVLRTCTYSYQSGEIRPGRDFRTFVAEASLLTVSFLFLAERKTAIHHGWRNRASPGAP